MPAYAEHKVLLSKVEHPIIFDVGAHEGNIATHYRGLFPGATIYAFEPTKGPFNMMVNKTKEYNIKCFNLALGDINGKTSFNLNAADQTNSLLSVHEDGDKNWGSKGYVVPIGKVDVDICTIDTFMEKEGIERIDILKMDTQGTEYSIIKGSKETIFRHKIKIIYMEIITMPTYVGQKHLDEIFRLLREFGFSLYNIYNQSYTDEKRLRQIDATFIHNSFWREI